MINGLVNGASTKRSALVALQVGRRTWKDLKKIQVAAAPAAGSVSFAIDSAPLAPQFRFPNFAVCPSEIYSVIASDKPLPALITVRSQAQKPLAAT